MLIDLLPACLPLFQSNYERDREGKRGRNKEREKKEEKEREKRKKREKERMREAEIFPAQVSKEVFRPKN